ncbi:uncharacterized protein METZ01_LOCUS281963, partial [marine metagenome]
LSKNEERPQPIVRHPIFVPFSMQGFPMTDRQGNAYRPIRNASNMWPKMKNNAN